MPRVAALLDVSQVTDVLEIQSENTFKRPMYAGNIIATVESHDTIKVMTIRTSVFSLLINIRLPVQLKILSASLKISKASLSLS